MDVPMEGYSAGWEMALCFEFALQAATAATAE
jgi:hypothetical protein